MVVAAVAVVELGLELELEAAVVVEAEDRRHVPASTPETTSASRRRDRRLRSMAFWTT